MKIYEKKQKFTEKSAFKIRTALITIDSDKLNEYSEFPLGSTTKIFTIILLLLLHQKIK